MLIFIFGVIIGSVVMFAAVGFWALCAAAKADEEWERKIREAEADANAGAEEDF